MSARFCLPQIVAVLVTVAALSSGFAMRAEAQPGFERGANASTSGGAVFFEWGGEQQWGGKRQAVRFHPAHKPGQIIVSFGDRRLYYILKPGTALSYPIAIPREKSRWEGLTSVTQKRENPSWTPTEEMLTENPKLPSWVPGGHPMNPLGVRALYLGSSTYRIHGTDAPWTIGQAVSKGCIRMYNEDVLDLYPRVTVGAQVTVTWKQYNTTSVASYDTETAEPSEDTRRERVRRTKERQIEESQKEKEAPSKSASKRRPADDDWGFLF